MLCLRLTVYFHSLISGLNSAGWVYLDRYLKAGDVLLSYTLQVIIPEAETRAGLALKPKMFPVTVTDRPVMDVTFFQFLASVSGKISCLGKPIWK